jgi:hypothetical protein
MDVSSITIYLSAIIFLQAAQLSVTLVILFAKGWLHRG